MMTKGSVLPARGRSYSIKEKLQHLRDFEAAVAAGTVQNGRQYPEHYRIPFHTFRKWETQRMNFEAAVIDHHQRKRKLRNDHDGIWQDMEDRLHEWFLVERAKGLTVSCIEIRQQATRLFQEWLEELPQDRRDNLNETRPERVHFHASVGWCERFKRRKRISYRKKNKNSSVIPADAQARIAVLRADLADLTVRFDIAPEEFLNMDQTFVLFDFPCSYTCDTTGERNIDVRTSRANTKLGCTVTLCVSSAGDKLKAHITFKRRGFVRQLEQLEAMDLPDNVVVTSSPTGWVRLETALHWTEEILERHVVQIRRNEHFILLVDRFRVHRTEDFGMAVMNLGGIIQFVPAGCTSLAQPLDIAVMYSFKSKVRRHWKRWKQDRTDINGQCDPINLPDVVSIISNAWNDVLPERPRRGFEVLMDGGEADEALGVPMDHAELIEDENNNDGVLFVDMPDLDDDEEWAL